MFFIRQENEGEGDGRERPRLGGGGGEGEDEEEQTRHNQEVTMMRERKRLNGKDPFRVPPGVGLRAHGRQIVAVVGGSEDVGIV